MKLLALDTATEACSAAVFIDGDVLSRFEVAPREHAQKIIPMMEALLQEAGLNLRDMDAIAFGQGPGSFTGVRVAASVVQGAAYGADLPVVPVSTLATLAMQAHAQGHLHVLAAIDARMQEVYWGEFQMGEDGLPELLGNEQVIAPASVRLVSETPGFGIGSGWDTYSDELRQVAGQYLSGADPRALPRAEDVIRLAAEYFKAGQFVDAADALPVYLRDNVAKKPGGKA
jgi:tRNA threonylcarbamoyladenosine biosynthesis protein TsaB